MKEGTVGKVRYKYVRIQGTELAVNTPGEIVYEDQYQVAVKVPGYLKVEGVQPSWSPKEET